MNSSGKVLIIFLVITAILLVSLTAISLFFFQKETERRKLAEATLEELQSERVKVEEALKDIKKQNFLLQEKNKEADERVNDLSDELELEKGLREEIKLEVVSLEKKLKKAENEKEKIAEEIEYKDTLRERLTQDRSVLEQKIKELEAQLKAEIERSQKLGQLYEQKQKEVVKKHANFIEDESKNAVKGGVELEEIVIMPRSPKRRSSKLPASKRGVSAEAMNDRAPEILFEEPAAALKSALSGQILSVDVETEFVIVNLGKKDGLSVGNVLSVYRNENYVGDIKITRLQSEMSAADLILPLSIGNIQKNDQVKIK